ncbi:hypothetical protein D3C71_157230 [compost metagenome]
MAPNTQTVTLRSGSTVSFSGKGVLGRILVGRDPKTDKPICWHLSGRWRWDDQDHPLDIVDGFTPES